MRNQSNFKIGEKIEHHRVKESFYYKTLEEILDNFIVTTFSRSDSQPHSQMHKTVPVSD